jgi:Xaa-Pro aminopeptidase
MQYAQRIKRIQHELSEKRLDALVVSSPWNVMYLTGFLPSSPTERESFLVIFPDSAVSVHPLMYAEKFDQLNKSVEKKLILHPDKERMGMVKIVASLLRDAEAKQVGIEGHALSVNELYGLKDAHGANYNDTQRWIERYRQVKDEYERALLRKAQSMTEKVFAEFEQWILAELSASPMELDCVEKIRELGRQHGADDLAFDTIVASGAGASQPHYHSTNKVVENNTVLLVDMGMKIGGYHGDFTRTLLLGEVADDIVHAYRVVSEANAACKKICKLGVTGEELYKEQQRIYKNYRLPEVMPHSLGHGVGLEIHEQPFLRPVPEQILEKGMVITIEPGYYVPGKFGIRVEDMVEII